MRLFESDTSQKQLIAKYLTFGVFSAREKKIKPEKPKKRKHFRTQKWKRKQYVHRSECVGINMIALRTEKCGQSARDRLASTPNNQ